MPVSVMPAGADLFAAGADVLVNPVNVVGVQGKGLALEFKRRFPALDAAYRQLCSSGQLAPGRPVLWRAASAELSQLELGAQADTATARPPAVLLFPTKRHWREPSRMEDVDAGLAWMAERAAGGWQGVVAMPALGCGLGGLDFTQVHELVERHLGSLALQVRLYPPH